ncbi:ATP-binding protein [Streptomyces sp. NBC_01306]|uniref:ATP-binding protein n=1 Tax=Streptomyces sp. NBC_01306 TaxID=2903819 RepID=UPI00225813E1|nr:bifunctional GNAT family N-acetyltransferase/ATP-binding protein [Streptomyces sp. NBC_01306]MCX4725644.1 bifunctional GNAT family N-acetyltransferase/ATP-binding protein [Streptomyces sp. NBC_01306]
MNWLIHDYREDDLASVVHLIDSTAELGQESVFSLAECIGALTSRQPAVVAISGGVPIGAALATVSGTRAWVMRIAIVPGLRGQGLASALLKELERRLVGAGVRTIAYVLPEEELLGEGLHNAGYDRRPAVAYFEKSPARGTTRGRLEELGGRLLDNDLWAAVAGMEQEKHLIEARVVRPLAEPERAARHGVLPPRAITLFGPPGTGKTTFARAIASRLGWPFVELLPSRLADEGNLAAALRAAFAGIAELERVLVFIDEVEEIAAERGSAERPGMHGVTNELLKLIPGFREGEERLLVCATNSIRSLDPAFLRPGRFDYLLPIGTPDAVAREAIWSRFTVTRTDVDVRRLVEASELFTPADMEHVARTAAQAAFERDRSGGENGSVGATTEDYLAALALAKPTVTQGMLEDFRADITRHARI